MIRRRRRYNVMTEKAMPRADPSRWVPIEDVANAIAYLLSDEADSVNGAVLTLPSR